MKAARQLMLRFAGRDAEASSGASSKRKQKAPRVRQAADRLFGGFPKVTGGVDPILMAATVAIVAFGVVMVYSASAVYARRMYDDGHYFLVRQGIFASAALPCSVSESMRAS